MPQPIAVPDEILTRRLRLRRHREDDIKAFQGFMTDSEATRFMPLSDEQRTAAGAKAMLLDIAGHYDSEAPVFSLTITLRDIDRYLGSCGLSPTDEDGVIEIYFNLVPAAQGHGYATEAVEALIDITRSKGTQRLVARIVDGNRPSVGVLERTGFRLTDTIQRELGSTEFYALELERP